MVRFVSFLFLLAMTLGASAQSNVSPGEVRVVVSVNYAVPALPGNDDDAIKAQENTRRALYGVADRECAVLRETLATECRLEAVNVNINRQRHGQQDMLNANASMTFRVRVK